MTVVAEKMFHVLECIAADDNDVVGLGRLTKRTNIPKATLYRLLCDLSSAGILDHGPGGYSLGTQLFELGHAVPRYRRLRRVALPHLEGLNQQTSETVHLAVLQRGHMVILDKVHGQHRVRIPTAVGTRLPLHSTALGKVTLAFAPGDVAQRVFSARLRALTPLTVCAPGLLERQITRVKSAGWATETEETINGVGCVAAPIILSDGSLAAVLSLAGDPRTRTSRALVDHLCRTAAEIASAVGDQAA